MSLDLLTAFQAFSEPSQLLQGEPMARHTTFRVGGPADYMFLPRTEAQVVLALKTAETMNVPALVMGNGSNMIVRDNGIRGLVVLLGEQFSEITVENGVLAAQAGASLAKAAAAAQRAALTGIEFASGIPGTVGGGCAMNAGAYGGQLSDALLDARVLLRGEVVTLTRDQMEMGYRTTLPLREKGVVLSARFQLKPGDKSAIAALMRELNARRREKQPLEYPSAGSVFKRPEGHFAGALIEKAGLKGASVGGAQVSPKHAGFIVNTGSATAADVLALIRHVQDVVERDSGIRLETEVRILGE